MSSRDRQLGGPDNFMHMADPRATFAFNHPNYIGAHESQTYGDHDVLSLRPVILPENKVILAPLNESDNARLIQISNRRCRERDSADASISRGSVILVQLMKPEYSSVPLTYIDSPAQDSSLNIPQKLISPRYLSMTSPESYRVQISAGSRTERNRKFSRNVKNELDALWLCEYALIYLNRPTAFEDIIAKGNYQCLQQRKIVDSVADFGNKLHNFLPDFQLRGLLKHVEYEAVAETLQLYVPYIMSHPNYHSSPREVGVDVVGVIAPAGEKKRKRASAKKAPNNNDGLQREKNESERSGVSGTDMWAPSEEYTGRWDVSSTSSFDEAPPQPSANTPAEYNRYAGGVNMPLSSLLNHINQHQIPQQETQGNDASALLQAAETMSRIHSVPDLGPDVEPEDTREI
mmetsp:Transcript_13099/g.19742  ORF Transcript_13099/g.19742 Transcript_13099/m.19742 type:complete len:404 (-) Transcript_13099:293-1504(-)